LNLEYDDDEADEPEEYFRASLTALINSACSNKKINKINKNFLKLPCLHFPALGFLLASLSFALPKARLAAAASSPANVVYV
jgi:hypothetical protein